MIPPRPRENFRSSVLPFDLLGSGTMIVKSLILGIFVMTKVRVKQFEMMKGGILVFMIAKLRAVFIIKYILLYLY